MLAVWEGFQEQASVFFGHQHFADNSRGPHKVVEILFPLLRLVVVELKLLVGREGTAHIVRECRPWPLSQSPHEGFPSATACSVPQGLPP